MHYTYDQVLSASSEYFNGDDLAAKVFVDKYALQNNEGKYLELTPKDMHKRIAKEFARIENNYPNPMSEDEIFGLIDNFKYIVPQGSPMSAIGNPYHIQSAGNCFVVDAPYDSYGGILKTDQELAQFMKRRCGVGVDLSTIRPRGMPTNNSSKTTDGVGVFMERYSNTTREVAQNGRRGALLESLSVRHPDILTFIDIKKDLKKLTGANISVKITDDFMNCVKNDELFRLQWPIESKKPAITKDIKASEIWNRLMDSAWRSAEPGILFFDKIINDSIPDLYADKYYNFKTQSTNPCQPAWATLLSPSGIITMGDAEVGSVIWSGSGWAKITNKVCTGEKDVYAFKTRAGIFYGTENHRVVSNGKKIEAKDAKNIDISYATDLYNIDNLSLFNKNENATLDIMDGLLIGDGMIHKASNNKILLIIGDNDKDYFNSEISDLIISHCDGIKNNAWAVKNNLTSNELPKTFDRKIPDRYKFGNFNKRRNFLRGLYSANGSVVNNRITLKASSFQIIEDTQQMLSSIGIPSYYTVNKEHKVEFKNGTYDCKESYDLNIGTLQGRKLFSKYIGFIQNYKITKVLDTLKTKKSIKKHKSNYDIIEKKFIVKEKVYDITVDVDEHTYWTGGLLVSNCGEIPLGLDSCRLMVLNLNGFVQNKFTKDAYFDFDKFNQITIKAQRLMDDLIDLEIELMNKIINKIKSDPEPEDIKYVELNLWGKYLESCKLGRRTGLGITALGDTLAMLNIKYGSVESIEMTNKIYRALAIGAHTSSCIMSSERGSFPIFDYILEKNHQYLNNIFDECSQEVKEMWKTTGRRNIALTTTAPTGSVSTLTQTTSGIEPVYLLSYTRRKKINPSDVNTRVDFTDPMGDKWQEFNVYHHNFKKWMDISGETDVKKSPYHNATSNDVDWMASVDIQAVAQKWIDHSISKTCNLPNSATKELVSQVYMRAWEKGCKGFTVYRDGCRTGVLVSNADANKNNRPDSITTSTAPKRPSTLLCDIKKTKIQGESWTFFVGLLDGKPYEVFGGLSKYVDIPNKYKSGKIIKNGKVNDISTYNVVIGAGDDEMMIKDVVNVFENANYGAFTRTISLALRHGAPVQYVVEQLLKDKHSDITSFSKVSARILKSYIQDGIQGTEKCPSCKAEKTLVYLEGCLSCSACKYSKC